LILKKEPNAVIYVVGAYPPKMLQRRASSNIIVTGWVDDIRPYFARGQLFVIPLLVGGGIRGKALEAMAMKRPIVTTSLGCEGINLKHEESALFADEPKAFAEAVVRAFHDASLRRKLTEQAYKNVVEGYSWEANGLMLEELYQSLRQAHGSNGAGTKPHVAHAEITEK
jgi:glycosyltransferase involved in cell wall biosynthesis